MVASFTRVLALLAKLRKKLTFGKAVLALTALILWLVITEDPHWSWDRLEFGDVSYRYDPRGVKYAVTSSPHGTVPLIIVKELSNNDEEYKSPKVKGR